jgi:DUF438 domain-containing protein
MELTAKTKLNDLLKKYPFLLEFLVKLTPHFEQLKNPALRHALGRGATLSQAARLGDVPLDKLLRELAGEIRRIKNESVTVSLSGAAKLPYEKPVSRLPLDVGALTLEQVNLLLKHLPVDVTLVDEEDKVLYYSDTKGRIFPRSRAVIGRRVQDCHPPASVHIVNKILAAFRSGQKDVAEFWIQMGERFISIRYFAVRDAAGGYRGCLEVSQDVAGIKRLEGERRLLDWK